MKQLHTAINILGTEFVDKDSTFTFTDTSKAYKAMEVLADAEIKFKCKLIFPTEKAYDSALLALRLYEGK